MDEASHSLVIQITNKAIKKEAIKIQARVIGHDEGMDEYKIKQEEFHVTLAMLKIKDTEGIQEVKKMMVDIKNDLTAKGTILKIRHVNTFPGDQILYAKVIPEPIATLSLILSVIEDRVSESHRVELINKQHVEQYVHHMTLFQINRKDAKTIQPNSYKEHLYDELGIQPLNIQLCVIDDQRSNGFYHTLFSVEFWQNREPQGKRLKEYKVFCVYMPIFSLIPSSPALVRLNRERLLG